MPSIQEYFDRIVVINLAHRTDRRREMEEQLATVNMNAEFFPASQMTELGDWPSLGARGCFHSHYSVLKGSLGTGVRRILFLEDDLDFSSALPVLEKRVLEQVAAQPWDFLYLGHVERTTALASGGFEILTWTSPVQTTHFYAVSERIIPRLVTFMEDVMSRPKGHPLGGPQHVDGAFSMFRAQNPDVRTLVLNPVLGYQRSSKSDITVSWRDRVWGLRELSQCARSFRLKHRLSRST